MKHYPIIALLLLFAANIAPAADIYWTNAAGGDFNTATNWNPQQVPDTNDTAYFNIAQPVTYTVAWSASCTNKNVRVQQGNITWDLGGQTYTLNNAARSIFGSAGATLDLTLQNGAVSFGVVVPIYYQILANATVRIASNVTGNLGRFSDSPGINAGGRLIIDGAAVTGTHFAVGGELIITNGAYCNGGANAASWGPGGVIRIVGQNSKYYAALGTLNLASTGLLYIAQGGWLSGWGGGNVFDIWTNSHVLLDDGSIKVNGVINRQAFIDGSGAISGYCYNVGGWVRPGSTNGVGRLRFTGAFYNYDTNAPANGGTVAFELAGPTTNEYDRLVINNTFYAGGTCTVSLINGYQPQQGTSFDILDWTSVSNAFASLVLPGGEANWDLRKLYSDGEIRYLHPGTVVVFR